MQCAAFFCACDSQKLFSEFQCEWLVFVEEVFKVVNSKLSNEYRFDVSSFCSASCLVWKKTLPNNCIFFFNAELSFAVDDLCCSIKYEHHAAGRIAFFSKLFSACIVSTDIGTARLSISLGLKEYLSSPSCWGSWSEHSVIHIRGEFLMTLRAFFVSIIVFWNIFWLRGWSCSLVSSQKSFQ